MVCTLGGGRMAAMARLLGTGKDPEMSPDEVGHEKLAAQSIGRDLCKADEPNLLDEEDMHLFDCRPMVDILHLVCCNNCKKPVKASQYAAHGERCRLLNCLQETFLEIGGGKRNKKPPRKGRKKLHTAHQGDDTCTSESVSVQTGITPMSREAKRNSASVVATFPSEKRIKIGTDHLLVSEGVETENNVITYQKEPTPLATKRYHSQRNLRIRYALNHLYHCNCNDTTAMMGKMRSGHLSNSYTNCTSNSGSSVGILQQPSGSVPVV